MKYNTIKKIYKLTINNKNFVLNSDKVGCFFCKNIFSSKEIVNYVDDGTTAICPKCDIDSIVCDSIADVNEPMLNALHTFYFKGKNV